MAVKLRASKITRLLPLELSAGQQCELFSTLWNGHEEFSHSLQCTQRNKLRKINKTLIIEYRKNYNLRQKYMELVMFHFSIILANPQHRHFTISADSQIFQLQVENNSPFPSCFEPPYESEVKCTAFEVFI